MRFLSYSNQLSFVASGEKQYDDAKPISHIDHIPSPFQNPHFSFNDELLSFLDGKQLLPDELPFPISLVHTHFEHGYVMYQKGITKHDHRFRCERCGNEDSEFFASFLCARCQFTCMYCRKCITMGRVSECTPLIISRMLPAAVEYENPLHWDGALSSGQQFASQAVVRAIENREELLIWAVCGAGKTEVLFAGIERALQRGMRVCIATPRTDVVLELAPRLKRVFPNVPIVALYGGSEDRGKIAPLVIATTHQLLRFYHAFDAMIIDEVDAFPYSVEGMLQYAAKKARKPSSSVIYLTATPSEKWKKEVAQGKRKAVTIPARYHDFPLPVPQFEWCGNWRKAVQKQFLPSNVVQWIEQRLSEQKPSFLFVPHIELLEKIVLILKKIEPNIEGVHAEDAERKEKVAAFRNGTIPLLVTTTILERGVTIPNLDVAVLGAEDRIFTEGALVQIAGRVGRSVQFPKGDVRFFHYGKTREMLAAKRHIEQMNKEASKRGMLKQG